MQNLAWLFLLFVSAYWGDLTPNVALIAVPVGIAVFLSYLFEISAVSISGWIGISSGALFGIFARWHFDKQFLTR
ncbi:MAG: hypothetical protein V3T56_05475 [Gemmatimonadales bacterium]